METYISEFANFDMEIHVETIDRISWEWNIVCSMMYRCPIQAYDRWSTIFSNAFCSFDFIFYFNFGINLLSGILISE